MTAYASTPQRPIDSGFGSTTTAADVLDGIDLTGRRMLVTGGHSGIGRETTRALLAAGASVIVPARRPDDARQALGELDGVNVGEVDLSSLDSVAAFADALMNDGRPLDGIIDSAGIMACPETRVGDGWEAQFATNHLGHFALVNRLWPLLADGGARVVSVSSRGHMRSPIRWHDLEFRDGYDKWAAYGQSKTANVLFAVWLDRLGADAGVRAFALHPGAVMTPLQRHLPLAEMQELGWMDADGNPIAQDSFKSTEQGAATQTWAATSPSLAGLGGVYCEDCDIASVDDDESAAHGVRSYAVDPAQAERLWQLSARLTGVDAFA